MAGTENYLEEHLPYELSMLFHTYDRLWSTSNEADWNAFLEAFCVHARNLKMFVTVREKAIMAFERAISP